MATSSSIQAFRRRLAGRLEGLTADSKELKALLFRAGTAIVADAKREASRKRIVDTGRLRQAITFKIQNEGASVVSLVVGTFGLPYAALNEFGGPFTEQMRRAMFASFRDRGAPKKPSKGIARGGRFKARPFLRPAVAKNAARITDSLRELVKGGA